MTFAIETAMRQGEILGLE
ncbi:hypothetical protein GGI1_08496 [Acidithiobacillus sp. GGI-221]|nr:hypothetical protein GGI1_08496 [Acidithiobacillus sp. GGI-221]